MAEGSEACIAAIHAASGNRLSEDEVLEIFDTIDRHRRVLIEAGTVDGMEKRLKEAAAEESNKLRRAAILQKKQTARNILARHRTFDQAMADTAALPRTVSRAAKTLGTVAQEKLGTPQAILDQANTAVGKPQSYTDAGVREIAAEYGINLDTGDFEEMAGIERLASGGVPGFKTGDGTSYRLFDDGTTSHDRDRAVPVLHVPLPMGGYDIYSDSALIPRLSNKPNARTERTAYVDGGKAAALAGPDGSRLAIKSGLAMLLHRDGVTSSQPVRIYDEPAVGREPLELWSRTNDVPGYEMYSRQHAGGAITEMTHGEGLIADDVVSLRVANSTIKRADDYAKAYKASAACLTRA